MQLWTKLTLGFAAIALLIVGVFGVHQLQVEQADLRAAAARDMRSVAVAISTAIADALRDGQAGDVRTLVDAAHQHDPSLDLVVLDPAGRELAASWGGASDAALVRPVGVSDQPALRFEEQPHPRLTGVFPIVDGSRRRVATLVLVRALDELQRDLAAETAATMWSLATLAAGVALAGWALSLVIVRWPLEDLVRAMRAVRAGDLRSQATRGRADELGAAAAEFNAMTEELYAARQRVLGEAHAREALEARLLHADKLVTVGQLAAGLAHEIGSPLQVLNGRARALAARVDLPADVARSAGVVARESERIAAIVERLLRCARRPRSQMAPMTLLPPVRDIVEFIEPEARRRGVAVSLQVAPDLPDVVADSSQVQQVALNLLTNALRATPSGGAIRVALHGSSGPSDGGVHLAVEDTGAGIPEAQVAHIFEPFFTTHASDGGTGLGLAVVRAIITAHGGAITVRSTPGTGTLFDVMFPAAGARRGGRVA